MGWGKPKTEKSKLHKLVEQLTQVRDGLTGELEKAKAELVQARKQQETEQSG